MQTELTVRQAAAALGLSPRTLRRHLQAGKLSGEKVLRGQQEVTVIQAAELVRFAQAQGYTLRQPGADTEGHTGAKGVATCGTEGQEGGQGVAERHPVSYDTERQTVAKGVATCGTEGHTVARPYDTGWQGGADRGGHTGARIAELEAQVKAVTQERDFLRQVVLNLTTKALPAAEGRSWWRRLWNKGETP